MIDRLEASFIVFLLLFLGGKVVEFDCQGSVWGTGKDVGACSVFAAVEDVEHVFEDGPAFGFFEGDETFEVLDGCFGNVDDLWFLFLETNETDFQGIDSCKHCLTDPLLQATAVG